MTHFEWTDFYSEFATSLLKYADNRTSLIEKIKEIYTNAKMKLPTLEKGNNIIDIDPFTVFGLFNKGITNENRIAILNQVKKLFNVTSAVPTNFDGIPVLNKKITELFTSQKDEWIAKHVAFDLRDKFDYRGKIKSLKNLDELKKLYTAERKSEEDIDALAIKYEELHDKIKKENNYHSILRHLDCKGFLVQYRHLFKLGKDVQYEQQVFSLLNSPEGDLLLKKIRTQHLSAIIP